MNLQNKNNIKLYTKGSFDSAMKHCSYIYENGFIETLTEDKIIRLREIERQESNQVYRVLAYAYKQINES